MKKKMRVGKSTDGLMGGKSKKPRHYIEIDDENGEVVVSKIMTHDQANPKHVNRLNNNFRKSLLKRLFLFLSYSLFWIWII